MSDRSSRKPVTLIGSVGMTGWAFAFFALLDTRNPIAITTTVTVGLLLHGAMYGPQAAFIAELFDTTVRYSGASVGTHLASVFAGALSARARCSEGCAVGVAVRLPLTMRPRRRNGVHRLCAVVTARFPDG
ncbi:MFS transporter [Actinomadura sp. 9N407]|uniref:MFS transporter n=1 Tax=Actinomadura sp. 9N407 TaxID=3375154 RepID=UPI0037A7CD17